MPCAVHANNNDHNFFLSSQSLRSVLDCSMPDQGERKGAHIPAAELNGVKVESENSDEALPHTGRNNFISTHHNRHNAMLNGAFNGHDAASQSMNSPSAPLSTSPPEPQVKAETEVVGGDITVKLEPGQAPKISRSNTKKIPFRPPTLFSDVRDSTKEALSTFERISDCSYANKYLGSTDHALECDCTEEWGKSTHDVFWRLLTSG